MASCKGRSTGPVHPSLKTTIKGQLHGKQIYRYKTGKVDQIVHYEHGIKHGIEEKYYPDGTLQSRTNYINGCVKDEYSEEKVFLTTGRTTRSIHTIEYLPVPGNTIKNGWNNKTKHGWEREYIDDVLKQR